MAFEDVLVIKGFISIGFGLYGAARPVLHFRGNAMVETWRTPEFTAYGPSGVCMPDVGWPMFDCVSLYKEPCHLSLYIR